NLVVSMVRRSLRLTVLGLLLAAGISRVLEQAGLYRCECYPECWCKRPGLSLFRWVVPRFHVAGLGTQGTRPDTRPSGRERSPVARARRRPLEIWQLWAREPSSRLHRMSVAR